MLTEVVAEAARFVTNLGTLGGFAAAALLYLVPHVRRFPAHIEEWVIGRRTMRLARLERERKMSELLDHLPAIRDEFKPDHGNSIRDRIDRACDLGEIGIMEAKRVEHKIEDHIKESKDQHRQIGDRLARLEGV